jgi:23S rRNA (uracil1939-C5)-methyltransferase
MTFSRKGKNRKDKCELRFSKKNMARKRIITDLEITGIGDHAKGIGRDEEGKVIFVDKVALGDVVNVQLLKNKKDFAEAVPLEWSKKSSDRTEPFCQHYYVCGGCQWQHVSYDAQLEYKQYVVESALRRIGKVDVQEILPIKRAEVSQFYRNKLEFSFSSKQYLTSEQLQAGVPFEKNVLGFHRSGAFDKIVDIWNCFLQPDPSNDLRNYMRQLAEEQGLQFWDARIHQGFLRHVMVRITTTGEVMLVVSFARNDQTKIKAYLDGLMHRFPGITSIYYCINPKLNDFVLDLDMLLYAGRGYIVEQLGHVQFRIGPKSFFQTNSRQAKVLYDVVEEFAQFSGRENVYDLYTGLGSIAQYVAHRCQHVIGIEEMAPAIDDANENARLNGITNCTFYAGDVRDMLMTDFARKHGKPDIVITDPPRAGMHQDVVNSLLKLEAPRIIYVSCNPATQARDLNLLHEKYDILKIQPVDMFPHTHHIESVALLQLSHTKTSLLSKLKHLLHLDEQ